MSALAGEDVGALAGGVVPDPRAAGAAAANAGWCEAVCRVHGIPGSVAGGLWRAGGEPPPFYPDVVALAPGLDAGAVADAVPWRAGASVKDSFGRLDLGSHGFDVLFEARWIWHEAAEGARPARPGAAPVWSEVGDEAGLFGWAGASGQEATFRPGLLSDPSVRLLTARVDGEVVGRAALCAVDGVVGVSNVWAGSPGVWESLGVEAARWFPGRPLAGYEQGNDLAAALAAGFEAVGRLRVWVRR